MQLEKLITQLLQAVMFTFNAKGENLQKGKLGSKYGDIEIKNKLKHN